MNKKESYQRECGRSKISMPRLTRGRADPPGRRWGILRNYAVRCQMHVRSHPRHQGGYLINGISAIYRGEVVGKIKSLSTDLRRGPAKFENLLIQGSHRALTIRWAGMRDCTRKEMPRVNPPLRRFSVTNIKRHIQSIPPQPCLSLCLSSPVWLSSPR
jgi:hypothetical protein